jgi:hypothetical protein
MKIFSKTRSFFIFFLSSVLIAFGCQKITETNLFTRDSETNVITIEQAQDLFQSSNQVQERSIIVDGWQGSFPNVTPDWSKAQYFNYADSSQNFISVPAPSDHPATYYKLIFCNWLASGSPILWDTAG